MYSSDLIGSVFNALAPHIAVVDSSGNIIEVNQSWRRFAHENDAPHPNDYVGVSYVEACQRAIESGDDLAAEALDGINGVLSGKHKVFTHRYPCNSPTVERWFRMTVTPTVCGKAVAIAHDDVSPLVSAEQRQRQLASELNHRVKNTLAVVQAIAAQTARSTKDPSAFYGAFSSRLVALARGHDLLTRMAWGGATLSDVAETALSPFCENPDAIRIDGPPVHLSANTAVSLNLAFHELATNAAKYGSLSDPQGHVVLEWVLTQPPEKIVLTWTEHGGPGASKPDRVGYGSHLMARVAEQLNGKISREFTPAGLRCTIVLDLSTATRSAESCRGY